MQEKTFNYKKMETSGFIRLIKNISQAKIGLLKLHDWFVQLHSRANCSVLWLALPFVFCSLF